MTELPQFVRRLPYVFYLLAVLLGGWRFYNEWQVAELTFQYGDGGAMQSLSKSSALYWGITEAAYMASSGAFLHVLIAIFDKLKGAAE